MRQRLDEWGLVARTWWGPTPYQGKAIGETSNCPVAAAIANAVADATGVRITDLPITAEKVLAGMKAKGRTP